MYWVKVLGSFAVLFAAGGLGMLKSMEYRKRIEALTQMRRLFLLLAGEIRSSHSPVPEAFARMAGRMEGRYREFLLGMAKRLSRLEGEQFHTLWREGLSDAFPPAETGFRREDLELIASFGDMFGYLDVQMQLNAIQLIQEQLLDRLGQLSASCAGQMRMARLLGVCAGVFVVLLLL